MAQPPPKLQRVAQRIERDLRRTEAIKLATDGVPYSEIADALGYNSAQAAHKDVKTALAPAAAAVREAGAEYYAIQAARLERIHREAWKIYEEYANGDEYSDKADQRLAALDRAMRANADLRRFVGLDAPTRTEQKVEGTVAYQVAVAPEELEQL
jgi:type II secretory pathway component PulJ